MIKDIFLLIHVSKAEVLPVDRPHFYISITDHNLDLFHESLISAQDIATMISIYYAQVAQEIWHVYVYKHHISLRHVK